MWAQGSHQSHLISAGISMDLSSHWTVLWMSQSPVLKGNIMLCLLFPSFIWERIHLAWWNLQTVSPAACSIFNPFSAHAASAWQLQVPNRPCHASKQSRSQAWLLQAASTALGGQKQAQGVTRGAGSAGHSPWQCQAHRREKGTEAFPWGEVWLVVTSEYLEPSRSAGKPSYYPLVTKRACETDVQSHAFQDADCSVDLSWSVNLLPSSPSSCTCVSNDNYICILQNTLLIRGGEVVVLPASTPLGPH